MIFHFLLLKAPVSAVKDLKIPGKCQKYLQKWGSLVRSSIPPAFTALQPNGPWQSGKCNSQEELPDRRSWNRRQVL